MFRIVAAGILCLTFLPASCTKQATTANQAQPAEKPRAVSEAVKARRIAELQKAYDAVVALQAATQVGVSYINYGPRLADTAAALAIFQPEDDAARAVAIQLTAALDDYRDAGVAWSIKLLTYPESDTRWKDFYSAHPWVSSELHLRQYAPMDSELDTVIRYLWSSAAVSMEAAREGLAGYKSR
jgi:hypothetical protein